MFITIDENMLRTDFNPMEDMEILCQTNDTFIVRTSNFLPTLMFVQECGWKLSELIPDDSDLQEFNILVYHKDPHENY